MMNYDFKSIDDLSFPVQYHTMKELIDSPVTCSAGTYLHHVIYLLEADQLIKILSESDSATPDGMDVIMSFQIEFTELGEDYYELLSSVVEL